MAGALAALKDLFSPLPMAAEHAAQPGQSPPSLKRERIADEPRAMAASLLKSQPDGLVQRLGKLFRAPPTGDLPRRDAIAAVTQAAHGQADSLHRLVMHRHKRLNAMQAGLAKGMLDVLSLDGNAGTIHAGVPHMLTERPSSPAGAASPKEFPMDVTVFSAKPYDRTFLDVAAGTAHRVTYVEAHLTPATAVLAKGAGAVCAFVNDQMDAAVLEALHGLGVRLVALRSAGFNNVDLATAKRLGMTVARVPAYSPEAVAEHTVALMLSLNRGTHRAFARVREGNFALDGLLGFNMHGRTVGVVGTGRIGVAVVAILLGFGCRVLAFDPRPDPQLATLGVTYLSLPELLAAADIVTLHCPLVPHTRHLIDAAAIARMRRGAMLINTSRGAIIDTQAVIAGLKDGAIGHLGLDVYEEEAALFFEDMSDQVIRDDVFARLLTFPNVLITGHQGFFTTEAMSAIAQTTFANIAAFEATGHALHEVAMEMPP